MKYSNIISISEKFKNSVNIEYDLTSYEKLAEYIPTKDICEVLRYYFESIEDSKYVRSTILEGPYGKGKSYLVLALLQMLFLDKDNKNITIFSKKLKIIDKDLCENLLELKSNGFKLLPVIINSNYTHLPQALNIALKDALVRIGLDALFPNTAFKVCLKVIGQWKKDKEIDKTVVTKCLEKTGVSLSILERGLKEFDSKSYHNFVKLYNCIVKGLEFNPFSNDDVVKNYSNIAYKLKDYGYNGIFIVFDEFSKFIDAENDSLSADLKILQDLAEMANRTGSNGQIHLCCITHKNLSNYYKNKKETTVNAFRTVEGRFKEIRFNRSLNQNYQIISLTLNKKAEFENFYHKFFENSKTFYGSIYGMRMFENVDHELISKNCFPLNPLTTYAVVHISELIAQNERTLFTFISDNDTSSLSTFINNRDRGLFNVDKIYDYFSNLLEKSEKEYIKKLNYKANICLSKVGDDLAKRIIKALTIIKIINEENYTPTLSMIALSLYEDESVVLAALNELVDLKLLKKSFATEYYDFALASSKLIDNKVDAFLATKAKKENISSILNSTFDSNYVLPRKYNTNHKMTRFYKEKFITDFELLSLKSFNTFFDNDFCDGIIFNVLKTLPDENLIKSHFDEMGNNETVILKLSKQIFPENIINEIFRINALQTVLNDKNLDEFVKEETRLIISDESLELKRILDKIYSDKKAEAYSVVNANNFNDRINQTMELVFNLTPIVNNEMINKEFNVSSQYVKPRNTIVNMYLAKDLETINKYSKTSPESTVYNSVKEVDSIEKRSALDLIKTELKAGENQKVISSRIVNQLKKPPYGIRSGVMPLLFAIAIYEMDDDILFYFKNREIDLNADNINKMIANPDKYYFASEEGSKEKSQYINGLLGLFELTTTNNYRDDIKLIVSYIQKWIMSQPRIVRSLNGKNNYINIDPIFIEFKALFIAFNINEHEVLLDKVPKLFGGEYEKVVQFIKKYFIAVNQIINNYIEDLAYNIKSILGSNSKSSLYNAFSDWIIEKNVKSRLLDNKEKSLLSVFDKNNYDDLSLVNDLAKNVVKIKVTDWEKDHSEEILSAVRGLVDHIDDRRLIEEVISKDETKVLSDVYDNVKISAIGNLLKNNIEEAFEEFGDSISNEEKISILMNFIKKMM